MKTRMRRITIRLDPDLARWAGTEAARGGTTVSRFLADILEERRMQTDNYEAAKLRALAREPFLKTDGRYLSREQTYDRERLR